MDSARLEDLHIVRRVRANARRWWGVELSFTDARGSVADPGKHGHGILVPPGNQLCKACLEDPEGRRRCKASIEQAVASLPTDSGASARPLGACHMGLGIVAAPIHLGGERQGSLFACGFLVEERAEAARDGAVEEARALALPVPEPRAAFDTVARIGERELPRLTDLMDTLVAEVVEDDCAASARDRRIRALQEELAGRFGFDDLVGKSEPMQRLYALLAPLAASDAPVFIRGENGTGKELVARALHFNGPRKHREFVAQRCPATGEGLLESELFGHVKGASSLASRDKAGLFELADGGTFFLDEVSNLSAGMQVKLLRVLQEGTFVPIGATRPEKVDARIIAASSKDLRELVARQQFREDLFYRLQAVTLEVPPLRERKGDLPLLIDHFLRQSALRSGKPPKRLHTELLASFYERDWPGNVSELESELERLVALSGGLAVIPPELRSRHSAQQAAPGAASRPGAATTLAGAIEELERELITRGLAETGGNKSRLAGRLGVSRTTLIKKIRDYRIGGEEPEPAA